MMLRDCLFKVYNSHDTFSFKFALRLVYVYFVFAIFGFSVMMLNLKYPDFITNPFFVGAVALSIILIAEIIWCKLKIVSLRNSINNYRILCMQLDRYVPLDPQGYGCVIRALTDEQVNRLSVLHSWLNYEMRLMRDQCAFVEGGELKKIRFYT